MDPALFSFAASSDAAIIHPAPHLQEDAMAKKEPFTISIPDSALDDLRDRLKRTRWPIDFGNPNWEYGTQTAYLKQLVEHWHSHYDWRRHEREMNSYNHFKTEIDGIPIHFIQEHGKGPKPIPLI